MRRRIARAAAVAGLLGPGALAFASGGYFDAPRLRAALVAWALVLLAALVADPPLPRRAPGRLAIAGLAALTGWAALSLTWTRTTAVALDDVQRDLLYLGALLAAAVLLRPRPVARLAEPLLVLGTVAAIGYGLSERVLPSLVDLAGSVSAGGRLELPLTYWNAEGALAALGWVLAVRIAGDGTRPVALRAAAIAAAASVLGLGVVLTFSRGALVAVAVGLVALLWFVPTRAQLRAAGIALAGSAVLAVVLTPLDSVRSLDPVRAASPAQGAALGLALVLVLIAAALLGARLARGGEEERRLALPRLRARVAVPAGLLLAAGVVAGLAAYEPSPGDPAFGATAARLGSVQSNRYAYWRVATGMWADAPLRGEGAGAFRGAWLERRTIPDPARDAHSLYVETLGELGLVGLAALLLLLGGVGVAARRALRADRVLAAGPAAAAAAWAVHAALDWDWEMPALTLVAVVCAGLLVAADDARVSRPSAAGAPGRGAGPAPPAPDCAVPAPG